MQQVPTSQQHCNRAINLHHCCAEGLCSTINGSANPLLVHALSARSTLTHVHWPGCSVYRYNNHP